MKTIMLGRGFVAMVDDADYALVAPLKWNAAKRGKTVYASNWKRGEMRYMHRLLTGAPATVEVDHRDGNGLNNQRYNLRFANKSKQSANRGLPKSNTSGFKGVGWTDDVKSRPWRAQIMFRRKNNWLGYFADPKAAARAYDERAVELFGEFALTNKAMGLL